MVAAPSCPVAVYRQEDGKRRGQLYIGCVCVLCVKHCTSYHKIVNWIKFHDVPLNVPTLVISAADKVAGYLFECLHCNDVAAWLSTTVKKRAECKSVDSCRPEGWRSFSDCCWVWTILGVPRWLCFDLVSLIWARLNPYEPKPPDAFFWLWKCGQTPCCRLPKSWREDCKEQKPKLLDWGVSQGLHVPSLHHWLIGAQMR